MVQRSHLGAVNLIDRSAFLDKLPHELVVGIQDCHSDEWALVVIAVVGIDIFEEQSGNIVVAAATSIFNCGNAICVP